MSTFCDREFSLLLPTCRPHLAQEAINGLDPIEVTVVDGTGAKSFSWLINQCILKAKHEDIVICADKARPSSEHVIKIIRLINEGFGLVALYRFGFFGFKKELIRRIGWFDERFVPASHEDDDFVTRLCEANIAYYESEEIPYLMMHSAWNVLPSAHDHFQRKWSNGYQRSERHRFFGEEQYQYYLGESTGLQFKPWSESCIGIGCYAKLETRVV